MSFLLDDYLRKGGYPETIEARSIASSYLLTLFDSIVWKDVVERHKVRNVTDLNNVALFLLREGTKVVRLLQVCYDMSAVKTRKRDVNND